MANKNYSLAHTKWMCKYHIVFTPKYRRKEIYNQVRRDFIGIFKRLCKYKGGGNLRRSHDARSCTYVSSNSSKNLIHGISKGKKLIDDIREACKPEV
ncbi:transposase IS200-family protein [Paenibacillus alvei DSM 29]|nr:transposase IS200-family protein [Paenibacillus alvei DSM 29]